LTGNLVDSLYEYLTSYLKFSEECDSKVWLLEPKSQFSVETFYAFLNCGGIKSQLV